MDEFGSATQKQHVVLKNRIKSFVDFYITPSCSHISVWICLRFRIAFYKSDS